MRSPQVGKNVDEMRSICDHFRALPFSEPKWLDEVYFNGEAFCQSIPFLFSAEKYRRDKNFLV
jgi:hypothetical protein